MELSSLKLSMITVSSPSPMMRMTISIASISVSIHWERESIAFPSRAWLINVARMTREQCLFFSLMSCARFSLLSVSLVSLFFPMGMMYLSIERKLFSHPSTQGQKRWEKGRGMRGRSVLEATFWLPQIVRDRGKESNLEGVQERNRFVREVLCVFQFDWKINNILVD